MLKIDGRFSSVSVAPDGTVSFCVHASVARSSLISACVVAAVACVACVVFANVLWSNLATTFTIALLALLARELGRAAARPTEPNIRLDIGRESVCFFTVTSWRGELGRLWTLPIASVSGVLFDGGMMDDTLDVFVDDGRVVVVSEAPRIVDNRIMEALMHAVVLPHVLPREELRGKWNAASMREFGVSWDDVRSWIESALRIRSHSEAKLQEVAAGFVR